MLIRTRTELEYRRVLTLAAALLVFPATSAFAAAGAQLIPVPGCEAAFVGMEAATAAQGYLGVDIRDVTQERISALKLKDGHGAEVIRVDHDGPAGKVGLQEHDVILQMNGQGIQGEEQLRRMLHETPAGRAVTLVISRNGSEQTISTRLANRTELERQAWEQHFTVPEPDPASPAVQAAPGPGSPGASAAAPVPSNGFFGGSVSSATTRSKSFFGDLITGSAYTGAMVENIGPQLATYLGVPREGVLVHSVDSNSPAASAGLRPGDIVLRANAATLMSTSDWTKIMHENKGRPVSVVIVREKKQQTLTLTPDAKKHSSITPQAAPGDADDQGEVVARMVGYSLR